MKKARLSKTQKDSLFVLALLETKRYPMPVSLPRIKDMISQSRPVPLDSANFRKGMHLLASRGALTLARKSDLSLVAALTGPGRHLAAREYRTRTGEQLDVPPLDTEQITIFEQLARGEAG
ncbi:MAG: hypothetical protein LPH21_16200 [Shewanella sp.]|nr:hypothetical protein [Shewanella sp.]